MTDPLRSVFLAMLIGLVPLLAGCQTNTIGTGGGPTVASEAEAVQRRPVGAYRLGSGDRLRVIVFNEEELTGEYLVSGAGTVSMPLIGEVRAAGLTVREFEAAARQLYLNGYLRNPEITAEVLNFRPYYILGEVNEPAEYPYTEGLTVVNAIATAGGFSYRANRRIVAIKPADGTQELRIELRPDTPVLPGDTIRVLERFF